MERVGPCAPRRAPFGHAALVGLLPLALVLLLTADAHAQFRSLATPIPEQEPGEGRSEWVERLFSWAGLVSGHQAGALDPEVHVAAALSARALAAIHEDLVGLREPLLRAHQRGDTVSYASRAVPLAEVVAALGLDDRAAAYADFTALAKRGATLHADVAYFAPPELAASSVTVDSTVLVRDGRMVGYDNSAVHWQLARNLLDLVRPSAAADPGVRRWYAAVGALMRRQSGYVLSRRHLARARELFPDDPTFVFLSGCLHESLAGPPVQSYVRTAERNTGVRSPERELDEAEAFFRRALALAPDSVETRVRLGHVLLARGRHRDAVDVLAPALDAPAHPSLTYFCGLFLGASRQALGQRDAARAAFERARAAYPGAQSVQLALAHLARSYADRVSALDAVAPLFRTPGGGNDPWWRYHPGTVEADADLLRIVRGALVGSDRR